MKNNWKVWVLYIGGVLVGMFLLLFLSSSSWIGYSVKEQCSVAMEMYEGDCVSALMARLSDQDNDSLNDRKKVVWALGQMGDKRALGLLNELYQGAVEKCNHKENLCQYEIKKAIDLIESGINLTAWIWR